MDRPLKHTPSQTQHRRPSGLGRKMSWSRLGSAALTLGLVLSAETALAQGKLTRVGVVVDGKAEFYEELATAFKEEAKSLIWSRV